MDAHCILTGRLSRSTRIPSAHLVALSIFLSPGFLIVDHMHFQYNGMMYGLLIYSMLYASTSPIASGLLFTVLLCFKHIYLYLAPAYFVYLLRRVVLTSDCRSIRIVPTIKLGLAVLTPLVFAFGPFILLGQVPQVISRLFPFNRGLCHAYWAPNFWAMYSFIDRAAIKLGPYLGLSLDADAVQSVTRGLVGDTQFAWLPQITPRTTFAITLAFQILTLTKLFGNATYETFLGALTLCGYASFYFGWHVHEKAVLLVIVPASFVAMRDTRYLFAFKPLMQGGYAALLPLIFTPAEIPVALTYTLIYLLSFLQLFSAEAPVPHSKRIFLLDRCQQLYTLTFIPLMLFNYIIHPIFFGSNESLEFLPLMLMSTYCAWGILWSWLGFNYLYFSSS